MILIRGSQVPASSTDRGSDLLMAIMEDPFIKYASESFLNTPAREITSRNLASEKFGGLKVLYVFQREYATVDPKHVDIAGTDEVTTCVAVAVAVRNPENGMTSIAHMDSPAIVEQGFSQMLSLFDLHKPDVEFDVHLIGGFEDAPANGGDTKRFGYSLPLCVKIVEVLCSRSEKFHLQNLFVLKHNTRKDPIVGNAVPIFTGFAVETFSGHIFPASFSKTTRCPDEIVRRLRVTVSQEDPMWKNKLLETYDTVADRFVIAPCRWSVLQKEIALALKDLSDSEILMKCSTSPFAEAADFVHNLRRPSFIH